MERVRRLRIDEAPPEVRSAYEHDERALGQVLNTTGIYAHRPSIFLGMRALGQGVIAFGLIPARLRSLMAIRIAMLIGCPF